MNATQIDAKYKTQEWYKFREKIFERDQHTCKDCSKKADLQAHHLKRAKVYPKLFFDESNCITLCKNCHSTRHYEAQSWKYEEEEHVSQYDYVRCLYCRINMHHPKYEMCYSCHQGRS